MDVDKWDYLKRDYYYLKHICDPNMNFDDVFLKAKVSNCGQFIEYRYEDYDKIHNLFAARWYFHRDCYQLPSNLIRDRILKLVVDETQPKIDGIMVEDIHPDEDMEAFLKLTDNRIIRLIEEHPLSMFLKYNMEFREVDNVDDHEVRILAFISFSIL